MKRVLDPAQIEALASRTIPRLILASQDVYARRAARLESLAVGHSLSGYLELAATLARAQHEQLSMLEAEGPTEAERQTAATHGMPPLPAQGMRRDPQWRAVLRALALAVAADGRLPADVGKICRTLSDLPDAELEARAARVLDGRGEDVDPASALFISAALSVLWTRLASRLSPTTLTHPEQPGPCPVCGMSAVASIVRGSAPYAGYRYLCCGLCESQWHRVRAQCTECGSSKNVAYQLIEEGPPAVRAETCDDCRVYRKIVLQELDPLVDPLADDLASLALDLLLSEAGFERAGANPLYWQPAG